MVLVVVVADVVVTRVVEVVVVPPVAPGAVAVPEALIAELDWTIDTACGMGVGPGTI